MEKVYMVINDLGDFKHVARNLKDLQEWLEDQYAYELRVLEIPAVIHDAIDLKLSW